MTRPAGPGPILSERIGCLPARQAANRRDPMNAEVRETAVRIETGKVLRILTNDLDAPAQTIAGLHERRWQIELFLRWVKQTHRITRLLGTSANAARIQIVTALIALLLLRMARQTQTAITAPLTFMRLVRDDLTHRRPIPLLSTPPAKPSPVPGQGQGVLFGMAGHHA